MEEQNSKTITAFDSLFTTNRIQMLKILLPRLAPEQQSGFAIYIKLLELQYTLSLLHRPEAYLPNSKHLSADFFSGDNSDTIELLDELLPYSSQADRSRIDGMKNMLQNMGKIKEMMEMAEMMKEMFPEGFSGGADNPMDILSGMAGMDMSSILQP